MQGQKKALPLPPGLAIAAMVGGACCVRLVLHSLPVLFFVVLPFSLAGLFDVSLLLLYRRIGKQAHCCLHFPVSKFLVKPFFTRDGMQ